MMIAARAVLGLGGESLVVAATTVIAKWFKGKELSFAFGIKITIARLASVASDNSPSWASKAFYPNGPGGEPSWRGPLLIAAGAGVLAVVCSGIYWMLERRAEERYPSILPASKSSRNSRSVRSSVSIRRIGSSSAFVSAFTRQSFRSGLLPSTSLPTSCWPSMADWTFLKRCGLSPISGRECSQACSHSPQWWPRHSWACCLTESESAPR